MNTTQGFRGGSGRAPEEDQQAETVAVTSEGDLLAPGDDPEEKHKLSMALLRMKYGRSRVLEQGEREKRFRKEGFRVNFRLSKAYRGLEKQEVQAGKPDLKRLVGKTLLRSHRETERQLEEEAERRKQAEAAKRAEEEGIKAGKRWARNSARGDNHKEDKQDAKKGNNKVKPVEEPAYFRLDPRRNQSATWFATYGHSEEYKEHKEQLCIDFATRWRQSGMKPWWQGLVIRRPRHRGPSGGKDTAGEAGNAEELKTIREMKRRLSTRRQSQAKSESGKSLLSLAKCHDGQPNQSDDNTPRPDDVISQGVRKSQDDATSCHNIISNINRAKRNSSVSFFLFNATGGEGVELVGPAGGCKPPDNGRASPRSQCSQPSQATVVSNRLTLDSLSALGRGGSDSRSDRSRSSSDSSRSGSTSSGSSLSVSTLGSGSSSSEAPPRGGAGARSTFSRRTGVTRATGFTARTGISRRTGLSGRTVGTLMTRFTGRSTLNGKLSAKFDFSNIDEDAFPNGDTAEGYQADCAVLDIDTPQQQTGSDSDPGVTPSNANSRDPGGHTLRGILKKTPEELQKEAEEEEAKPLRAARFLYALCNCERVGRPGTLAKLQRKKRSVGVIELRGCPEDPNQALNDTVCPFCSVFPRRRVKAWLEGVIAIN